MELYPHGETKMILTCNGPFCGKSKRTSEQLVCQRICECKAVSAWNAGVARTR